MRFCFTILLLLPVLISQAQATVDYAVLLTASTSENPASITLHWNHDDDATNYSVYRKPAANSLWGAAVVTLPGDSLQYKDVNVQEDSLYEYMVKRTGNGITAYGYLTGAIKLGAKDHKGFLLLVTDTLSTDSLDEELDRLIRDIANDGWGIRRIDISRNDQVSFVKDLIKAEFNSNPDLKALLLFGHVPVPYSGEMNPDGHPDHYGAWPADVYYGEMDADWTDNFVNTTVASRPENWNVPGDGKPDETFIPDLVDLQVGRIDLYDLPSFIESETELLQRYLNKDHEYRIGNVNVQDRGLIDDNFGAFSGEAFATNGFRNFAPLMGTDAIDEADYFSTLYQTPYLWSYGCGGGWYQGAGGVGSTTDFTVDTVKTVFTMLFGSYFGDWDNYDNFLRAPLASNGFALTNCWAGRPHWFFHYMGLGENIGYCARLTQNNISTYVTSYGKNWVHIGLMGDPTLRMHNIKPPSDIVLSYYNNDSSAVEIAWTSSPDSVLGYYVYRGTEEFGKYDRISDTIVAAASFIDHPPAFSNYFYRVRAVHLQETPSGSYYNLSGGITDSIFAQGATGIDSAPAKSLFTIYPNPASEQLIILFNDAFTDQKEIIVNDITGKEVISIHSGSKQHEVLNVGHLHSGIYLISIGKEVRKFVKE